MSLREEQRRILEIIGEIKSESGMSVFDTATIHKRGLPAGVVNTYIKELESLGLIILGLKTTGANYRLVNITRNGLNAI
jgi:predicted transcriptional regulator